MSPAATKCCYLIWISYIRPTEKQEPKKWQKWKNLFEKVKISPLSSDRRLKVGLLEKRVLGRARRSSEKRLFGKRAPRCSPRRLGNEFAVNCNGFIRKFAEKKKRKKCDRSKHMVFCVQVAKPSILAQSVAKNYEATKSQQQTTDPGGTWFCVSVVTIGH